MPPILEITLGALALTAGVWDLRLRRIPNWLSLSGILIGLCVNATMHGGTGALFAAEGILCAALVYLPLYALGGMAAGDVKLMAAVGAIAGPANWFAIFLLTAVLGGVWAIALVLSRGRTMETLGNVALMVSNVASFHLPDHAHPHLHVRSPHALKMPHGVAIAGGCLCFLLWFALVG